MDQQTLQAFIIAVENLAAAAALVDPNSKEASPQWQLEKAFNKLCKKFSNRQNVDLATVVDKCTISLNDFSRRLNVAKAQAEAQVVTNNPALVAAALASINVPE